MNIDGNIQGEELERRRKLATEWLKRRGSEQALTLLERVDTTISRTVALSTVGELRTDRVTVIATPEDIALAKANKGRLETEISRAFKNDPPYTPTVIVKWQPEEQ